MTKPRHKWKPCDDDALRAMCERNCDWPIIAKRMGRTICSVRRRAQRLDLKLDIFRDPKRGAAKVAASYTPERRARYSDRCKRIKIWEGGHAVIAANPQINVEKGKAVSRAKQAWWNWCPPQYRDQYRALTRSQFTAAEARAIVEAQIAKDARTPQPRPARDTSFEAKLARVASGQARIYEMPRYAPALDGRS